MNINRITALTVKEAKQLVRDPMSILLGILLPAALLLVCGYGMSTDIRNIKLVIVVPESSEYANQVVARFSSNDFFQTQIVRSTADGEQRVKSHAADVCLFLPQDFSRKCEAGDFQALIAVNASNPTPAFMKQSYLQTVLADAVGRILTEKNPGGTNGTPTIEIRARQWFNDANVSAYTIVSGIIVIVLTIIGAMLTSMVMAREYEHGNLESLFVTPMQSSEILLAKMINNFALGIVGLAVSLVMARFLFGIPMRGNLLILLLGSSAYLVMALAMGLLVSIVTKNQFLAVSISVVLTFLPSYLLSGFLFEIKSMPLFLQWVTVFVPARYYVDFLQTSFLVGNVWPNVLKNIGILLIFDVVFLILAALNSPKRLA